MKELKTKQEIAKADVYRLLAACFYEPTNEFLEENLFSQLEEQLSQISGELAAMAKEMDVSFRKIGPEPLLLDYTRLFLGPFDILAKPYGSVYLDGEKVVMGDSTMRAIDLYQRGGFEIAADFSEMPDHVAAELEYLYLLTLRLAQVGEEESDELKRLNVLKNKFLQEHLGNWVSTLADRIRKSAETDFYQRVADLTERFVFEDRMSLAESGQI